jgi:acetyl esterase/lipase
MKQLFQMCRLAQAWIIHRLLAALCVGGLLPFLAVLGVAAAAPSPDGVSVERDVAWGPLPDQTLDVYRPGAAAPASAPPGRPLLLMVHGGGWAHGDKQHGRVVEHKVAHWVGQGAVLVSINYRLLPQADPAEQAREVARALAFVQSRSVAWGVDPGRLVLIGHSAGAHLVALLSADPALARSLGAGPWRATVALDSAAMNVPAIMQARHFGLYDRAFGKDPAFWHQVSPWHRLSAATVPMLMVCSSRREVSCEQASAFAAKARGLGGVAELLPQPLSHGDINAGLGEPGAYTEAVDGFLKRHAGF